MYLIDSSVWIDFLKNRDERLVPYLESREACLTDIVLFELLSGFSAEKQKEFLENFSLFQSLPLGKEVATLMAPVAHLMRKKGFSPQTTDLLIAGISLFHHAELIHKDLDFEMIKKFCPLKTISFLEK